MIFDLSVEPFLRRADWIPIFMTNATANGPCFCCVRHATTTPTDIVVSGADWERIRTFVVLFFCCTHCAQHRSRVQMPNGAKYHRLKFDQAPTNAILLCVRCVRVCLRVRTNMNEPKRRTKKPSQGFAEIKTVNVTFSTPDAALLNQHTRL